MEVEHWLSLRKFTISKQFPESERGNWESMGFDISVPAQEIALATKEVPSHFIVSEEVQRTLEKRDDVLSEDDALQLPVIDLRQLLDGTTDDQSASKVRAEIRRACEDWGFFQVGSRT
jgi:hypothetical protein